VDDRHARHRRATGDRRRRPSDGFRATNRARFERLVADAVATLPPELLRELDRVQLWIEEVPPDPPGEGETPPLARYVVATPSRRRAGSAAAGSAAAGSATGPAAVPADRLILFRRPLELRATSKVDLAELVRFTVVHELAHHLGIDDDRLDELGWG
jgi:predicted Zn-dependent protease with MMP-like domain